MHAYDAHGLPYFISSSSVMQFREVCYTVVSYAPYILLQIYTITNLATFGVTIFDIFSPWAPAYNGQLVYLCPVVIKVDIRLSRAQHFRSRLGCIEAQTIPGLCCLSSKLNVFFVNVSHLPVKTTVEIHTTIVLTVTTMVTTLFVRIRATPNNCIIAVLEISVAPCIHIRKLFSGNYGQDKSRAGCTEVQAVRDFRCLCYRVHFPNRLLKLSIS